MARNQGQIVRPRFPSPSRNYNRENEAIFRHDLERILQGIAPGLVSREVQEFVDGDTSPSVGGAEVWKTANTASTTISTLDDGEVGQEVTIIVTDGNTTFEDQTVGSGNLHLQGGGNYSPGANDVLVLVFDGTNWYEVSRSNN